MSENMADKCFCHLDKFRVKDAEAREQIAAINEDLTEIHTKQGDLSSKDAELSGHITSLQNTVNELSSRQADLILTDSQHTQKDNELATQIAQINAKNIQIESTQAELSAKDTEILKEINTLKEAEKEEVPDYWKDELQTKASAIQTAMELAGNKKSAFLWYTDAHWPNGNTFKSPMLLNYLYRHTPMNKVIFGGDIIGDGLKATRKDMEYLYDWRSAIKDLPNHHSVLGNHDIFDRDNVDYEDDNYRYAFMLAPEETPDMVMGDGLYYYIDNNCEKTRYIYLSYWINDTEKMKTQGRFIVNALNTVNDGWHIVVISHRWWTYGEDLSPESGSLPEWEGEVLSILDYYNVRGSRTTTKYFDEQNFASAKGKVEFCIGGHIHTEYNITSTGGIPVIMTTADANQSRIANTDLDKGTPGTTTESAVYGIIADYNDPESTKITVVGVGRGTQYVVRQASIKPTSIEADSISYSGDTTVGSNIEKSKFTFTVNYSNGKSETINGATSVSPGAIGVAGDNPITITYTEGGVTLSATVTITGTEIVAANLFDKADPDVTLKARINSSGLAKNDQGEGQLVTGFIEGKVGDTFRIETDKNLKTNNYTCMLGCYKADKSFIGSFGLDAVSYWTWSEDNLTGTIKIPSSSGTKDFSTTALVRFAVAYNNIDNIKIYKS